MYSLIFVLKPVMKVDQYRHFMKYIVFLRLLTQDSVTQADIDFSRVLIHEFLKDFTKLYPKKAQTFNLHCHCHLADQVERHGPMHKCDCVPIEGWFKNAGSLHNGTLNLSVQIANNLNEKITAHFTNPDVRIDKKELREFYEKLSFNWDSNQIHFQDLVHQDLLTSLKTTVKKDLIKTYLGMTDVSSITYSYKAIINNTRNFKIRLTFKKSYF